MCMLWVPAVLAPCPGSVWTGQPLYTSTHARELACVHEIACHVVPPRRGTGRLRGATGVQNCIEDEDALDALLYPSLRVIRIENGHTSDDCALNTGG